MKKVVQDLTSGGIDWQREKWQSGLGSKFIHQGEKNAVKYADEVIVLSKGVQGYFKETYGREEIAERKKVYTPLKEESRRLEVASDNVYSIFRKTNEMKSDLAWKREWEARVREKARQEQVRQEQRVRQPKRKKRSYDVSL